MLTVRRGQDRQNLAYTNGAELARQLGAMPPTGSVGEKLLLGAVNARDGRDRRDPQAAPARLRPAGAPVGPRKPRIGPGARGSAGSSRSRTA